VGVIIPLIRLFLIQVSAFGVLFVLDLVLSLLVAMVIKMARAVQKKHLMDPVRKNLIDYHRGLISLPVNSVVKTYVGTPSTFGPGWLPRCSFGTLIAKDGQVSV